MPLIILTGYPASGKSTRAQQLADYFTQHTDHNVTILSENDFARCKTDTFSGSLISCQQSAFRALLLILTLDLNSLTDSSKEKQLRGLLKSEMQRLISPSILLILDGGNYIKGECAVNFIDVVAAFVYIEPC